MLRFFEKGREGFCFVFLSFWGPLVVPTCQNVVTFSIMEAFLVLESQAPGNSHKDWTLSIWATLELVLRCWHSLSFKANFVLSPCFADLVSFGLLCCAMLHTHGHAVVMLRSEIP